MINRAYISRFGLCSAAGIDLKEHISSIKKADLKPNTSAIEICESGEKYTILYYKAKASYGAILEQIGDIGADTALFVGSSSCGVELNERDYKNSGMKVLGYDTLIPKLREKLGLKSNHILFNTACTSSANALIYAARLIQEGSIKNALVIGAEIPNMLSLYGFMSLGLLSKNGIFPFDKRRDGIVLGEAYGYVLLSNKESKWEFLDGTSANDTTSVTSPSIEGKTLSSIINEMFSRTRLNPADIDLIKLHATASESNDISENAGLCAVFPKPPLSVALKGYIGHTLGACGVCELAFLLGALEQNIIPKSLGFEEPCENFLISPTARNIEKRVDKVLLNYLAFGGNTAAMIVQRNAK